LGDSDHEEGASGDSSGSSMKENMSSTTVEMIHQMDVSELRIRYGQLLTDMKNRSKWEAVRLMESLKRLESEVHEKVRSYLSTIEASYIYIYMYVSVYMSLHIKVIMMRMIFR
jgi:hypothetical protein